MGMGLRMMMMMIWTLMWCGRRRDSHKLSSCFAMQKCFSYSYTYKVIYLRVRVAEMRGAAGGRGVVGAIMLSAMHKISVAKIA